MKGLVTWLVPQHVLPASHTHCSAWPSTMETRTSISMTLVLNKHLHWEAVAGQSGLQQSASCTAP